MKKWKPERRDGLLLLGIGLGAAVGLLRGALDVFRNLFS